MQKGNHPALLVLALGILCFLGGEAWAGPFQAGSKRELGLEAAAALRIELLAEKPHTGTEEALWRVLTTSKDLRVRVGAGLALVDRIFPGGDPALWGEVHGWWLPRRVPRSLGAADAAILTASLATALPDPAAPWLAYRILEPFFRSSDARYRFGRLAPQGLEELLRSLSARGVEPPEGWPEPFEMVGVLPLACPLEGTVPRERALMESMVFLDTKGRIADDARTYAWDRAEGRLHEVVEDERFPVP